jgi:RNA polymerase sigma factor (sigma-70 family)
MRLPSELEQPPLSTDLEWMLTSSQTSVELIVEAVVHEHFASLYRLALAYLEDLPLAERAVQQALISVVENRHRFHQSDAFKQWLFQQLIVACRRLKSQVLRKSSQSLSFSDDPAGEIHASRPARSEDELWQMVDESGEPSRSVLLLYYLVGIQTQSIAAILAIHEADVASILVDAHDWLTLVQPEGTESGEDPEFWVVGLFQRRWSPQKLSEADQDALIMSVIHSLDERRRRKQAFNIFQQILSVLAVLAILAIVGWLTNQVFRVRPQQVIVYITATPKFRPTLGAAAAFPTELPDRMVQRLPPLPRQHEPLNASSQPDEIRQRMYESRSLWSNVWVDAQLIRYGPDGFVGPAEVYSNLMWINNPSPDKPWERRLVISESADGNPLYASLVQDQKVHEIDLRNGLAYTYNLRQNNPFYDAMSPGYRGMYRFDLRGVLDGTYLSGMLFSAGLVSLPGKLEVVGTERLLGREVVMVINHLADGHMEQLWLDPYTGMVLRWKGYGSQTGKLLAEMIVSSIAFETRFPDDVLSSASFQRLPVTLDSPSNSPAKISPRCVTFQWPDVIDTQGSLSTPVQLFSDGSFLGQVQISEPWHIQCKRSASGDMVACLNPPPGVGGALYAESSLFWFNLTHLNEVHRVLPGAAWISSDFAFSPDGNYLAFWACTGGQVTCGIYILDTATLQPKKLIDEPPAATFFTWSPDSKFLSYIRAGQTVQDAQGFVIVRVDTGEIADAGPFFWPDMNVPPDSLAYDLGIQLLPVRNEYSTCAQPRSVTQ